MANNGDNVNIGQLHTDIQIATQRLGDMQKILETMAGEMTSVKAMISKFAMDQAVASARAEADRSELAGLAKKVGDLEMANERLKAQVALAQYLVVLVPAAVAGIGFIASVYRK